MGRTLKFRVWSDYHKKFVINGGEFGISRLFEDFSIGLDKHFPRNNDYKMPHYISDYAVQQWTGLFDSAGREIYEGDIVEYECNDPRFSRSVVRWTHEHEDNHPGFMISSSWSQYGEPTIVGNIYENSELLVN